MRLRKQIIFGGVLYGMLSLFALPVFSAFTFPLTVNVDADVTFKNGGQQEVVSVVGGVAQNVTLSWLSGEVMVDLVVVSKNTRYNDSTFSTTIGDDTQAGYPTWSAATVYATVGTVVSHNGKLWKRGWWTQGDEPGAGGVSPWEAVDYETYILGINLSSKPLPLDTAFVPISVNVDSRVVATSGDVRLEKELVARTLDTLILPLRGGVSPLVTTPQQVVTQANMVSIGGRHLFSLPRSYHLGEMRIFSLNGRQLSRSDLTGATQSSFTINNVASGMYLVNVRAKTGASFTQKLSHGGGAMQISASFGNNFVVGGFLNAQTVRVAPSATLRTGSLTREWRIAIEPHNTDYPDTTFDYEAHSQMNDVQPVYILNPTGSNFDLLLDEQTYEELFPNRFGFGYGNYISTPLPDDPAQISKLSSDGDYDYFSYASLQKAIDSLGQVEVDLYVGLNNNGEPMSGYNRIVWSNKRSGETREFKTQRDYDSWDEKFVQTIDYARFCNEGDIPTRKQELAAFLGNISHETTGGGSLEKTKKWGLYWREEVAWQNGGGGLGYVDQFRNDLYPATPGKSYHGRGPIQLTHNVNYGQLSQFLYGDARVLENPDLLCPDKPEDATLAFMSAIWFWMTPQEPKPSCHDVMVGNWEPTADDISNNRDKSRFGMTVNIINGGLECGIPTDGRVLDRIEFYQRYIKLMGETPEVDCECADMRKY